MSRRIDFLNGDYCRALAPLVRQADRNELWASHHIIDLEKCLISCLEMSHESWIWIVDDKPVCAFGIAPCSYLTRSGRPWLIGTDAIMEHKLSFIKNSKLIVDYWADNWDSMSNYVDARNLFSIKWLKYLGFTIYDAEPYGVEGLPFHRFERKRGLYV